MKFLKLFVAVVAFMVAGIVNAANLPIGAGGVTVRAGAKWVTNPLRGGILGGGQLPVVDENMLDDAPFRVTAKMLSDGQFPVLGDLGTDLNRWNLVSIGCSYHRRQGYCGVSFNSTNPGNGSQSYGFPVNGDPTRVGRRSFLGIIGRRAKIGSEWMQTYYFESPAAKSAFIAKIILARP